jgi:hypothetical protein
LANICGLADNDIAAHGLGCTKLLEERLEAAFRDAGRDLMEALVTQQGAAIPGDAARPGEVFAGQRKRTIDFLFGAVEVERNCYSDPASGGCRFPMDDALSLIRGVTPAVAARVAMRAAVEPFGEASDTCSTLSGLQVSPYRIRQLAREVSGRADCFIRDGTAADRRRPDCVVVEVDGKGVPTRRKELEESGVKGKGKDGQAKTREVKAAAIFTFTPNPGEEEPPERDARSTHYLLSTKTADEFGKELWDYYEARFPGKDQPPTLFISDAASGILNIRANWFPDATGIIDFHHASEHLSTLLDACGLGGEGKEGRRKEWSGRLLAGEVERIIEEAERMAADKEACRKALHYFVEGKEFMRYDEYRAKGWFIGSGVIEAACKSVVAGRFCKSGMFWSKQGLDAMLPLRAVIKSQRYTELWAYALKGKRQIAC